MNSALKIALTTGDPDGIGTEVASKALSKLKGSQPLHIFMYRSSQCPRAHLNLIDKNFYRVMCDSTESALKQRVPSGSVVYDIVDSRNPIHWVKDAAKGCMQGSFDALVTGPLSKPLIVQSGLNVIGHTGLFRKLCPKSNLFMGFLGQHFSVALVSDHIPLGDVAKKLTSDQIYSLAKSCMTFLSLANGVNNQYMPLGILGLNPHAGDGGLIGSEEHDFIKHSIKRLKSEGVPVEGPLVPDAAFLESQWKKYSFYICQYHDQGLIPFKLVHGQNSGTHITLGLPFIRTSVDHGTAKDIFNLDKANPNSMLESILWAIQLSKQKRN